MRHCQIQCNFEGIDDLYKLGKEYLIALSHWHANYAFHSRHNAESFDILHAFLSLVVAKLSDLKNSPVNLAHPALCYYNNCMIVSQNDDSLCHKFISTSIHIHSLERSSYQKPLLMQHAYGYQKFPGQTIKFPHRPVPGQTGSRTRDS